MLINPNVAVIRELSFIAKCITHEISHQWFGNLVTMTWWGDAWLYEGFATYLSIRAVNNVS